MSEHPERELLQQFITASTQSIDDPTSENIAAAEALWEKLTASQPKGDTLDWDELNAVADWIVDMQSGAHASHALVQQALTAGKQYLNDPTEHNYTNARRLMSIADVERLWRSAEKSSNQRAGSRPVLTSELTFHHYFGTIQIYQLASILEHDEIEVFYERVDTRLRSAGTTPFLAVIDIEGIDIPDHVNPVIAYLASLPHESPGYRFVVVAPPNEHATSESLYQALLNITENNEWIHVIQGIVPDGVDWLRVSIS